MKTRLFSILAIPMVFLAQCAPQCAPAPVAGDLRQGTFITIGAVETYGYGGHIGVDYLDRNGNKICPDRNCGYWGLRNFQPGGSVDGGGVPVDPAGVEMARIELYPDVIFDNWGSNDAWNTGVPGGIHLWNPDGRPLYGLRLPFGANGAFHYVGSVTDGGRAISEGRFRVYAFQLVERDTTPGAFNISYSRGTQWTAGYIWPGTYILEMADLANGRTRKACVDIFPGAAVNVDLAATNFGLAGCPF